MLLNKTIVGILVFFLLLTIVTVSVFLFAITQKSLWQIGEFNQAPDSPVKNLSPKSSIGQEFVAHSDWSTILVQHQVKDTQADFTIAAQLLVDDTPVQQISGKISQFTKPLPDIIIRNPDYGFVENMDWLIFNFAAVDGGSDKAFKIILTTDYTLMPRLSFPFEQASEKYLEGSLLINGESSNGNLGFVVLRQVPWATRLSYRLIDRSQLFYLIVIVLICLVLTLILSIYVGRQQKESISFVSYLLLLAILALIFTLPLYKNSATTGVWDWPEAASHYSAARLSLTAGEFPLWTPQFCGGAPMWQSPQAYWPSLTFVLTLLFGNLAGSRLAISIYIFLGLWGMTKLSRHLRLGYPFALIPAIVFVLSGFFSSHLAAGQMLWLTIAWIPWTIYFFLKSFKRPWLILPAALFYLLIFFEGRVYITAYLTILIPLLALVICYITKKWRLLISRLIAFALLVVTVGAIKIIPTVDFLKSLSGSLPPKDGIPARHLLETMITRTVQLEYTQPWMQISWHEYAAYVGIIPLLLSLLGVIYAIKTKKPVYIGLILSALLFLLIAISKASTNPFNFFPILKELHNPGRSILMVIFSISLLAGLGAQTYITKIKQGSLQQLLGLFLALFLFVNLFVIARPAWSDIFSQQHQRLETASSFYQSSQNTNNAYPIVEAGGGAKDYCPTYLRDWRPNATIYSHEEDEYLGEAYTKNSSIVSLSSLTPNSITVLIEQVTTNDTVYINQKYDTGWRSKDKELFSDRGRLTFNITERDVGQKVVIKYLPKSFVIGTTITLFSSFLLAIWGIYRLVVKRNISIMRRGVKYEL